MSGSTSTIGSETIGSETIGWGIVSTGHIASVFAEDLALLPEEGRLVAVSSRRLASAQSFAAAHRTTEPVRAYDSVADLAADPAVDVVYVASIHSDHLPAAAVCLKAGKGVLVEKPLTTSAADTAALVTLARDRGRFLMEAVWTRTNPLVRKAVELVRGGAIGIPRHLDANFGFALPYDPTHRLYDPAQAGGALLDLGIYPVHMAQLLLGEPLDLAGYGRLAESGVDSHAAAVLRYADATASLVCSLETTLPTRLEVFGSDGKLVLEPFIKPVRMDLYRGSDVDTEPERFTTQLPGRGYTFEAQEVVRCLRAGLSESPLVPWTDSEACARTLERWRTLISGSRGSRASTGARPWTS